MADFHIFKVLPILFMVGCGGGSYSPPAGTPPPATVGTTLTLNLSSRTVVGSTSASLDDPSTITMREVLPGSSNVAHGDGVTSAGIGTATPSSASTNRFYIASTELTRAQWASLVSASGATADADPWIEADAAAGLATLTGSARSASGISYDLLSAVLTAWNARSPHRLRLPSGHEWEVACLASATTAWSWGNSSSSQNSANYALTLESGASAGPGFATDRLANAWGLRDMHGNTWEWVSDGGETASPCLRGGSWSDRLISARTANRLDLPTYVAYPLAGIRLVLEPQ